MESASRVRTLSRPVAPPVTFAILALTAAACGADSSAGDAVEARGDAVTSCADNGTVEGIDVSEHNGWIDWTAVKKTSVKFAFIKATQGTAYNDPGFAHNWPSSKSAGVIRGAYHFFDPTVSGVTQANHFLDRVGTLDAGDLPPVLDLECPDGNPQCLGYPGGDGWDDSSLIQQRALDWLSTVQAATGKKPIVYTYSAWFAGAGVSAAPFAKYTLWQAMISPSNGCFSVPGSWTKWTFWQYGWHGWVGGVPTEVDVDRFNGTLADLVAYAGGSAAPNPQPSGGTCPYGDGRYCGGNGVGGNPLKLYDCDGGTLTSVATCSLGCERMPIGVDDKCFPGSTCPLGTGDYCGGNGVGGDPDTLYHCNSGQLTKIKTCTTSCKQMPNGQNDVCN